MDRGTNIVEQIKNTGLLPLFYHADAEICASVVGALYDGGVRAIEFTNRGEKALENFKSLVGEKNNKMPGLLLGIGTIKTAEQATSFIEAGADFLVSPVYDNNIFDIAYMNKILWIPGCMTPTEIYTAEQAGCKFIKLFPGNVLGPGFIESIKPLFPNLEFVVTGGVDTGKKNIRSWFDAGVSAVGMGTKLISKTILDEKDFKKLTREVKEVLEKIGEVRK
jgi:2-dehydro-3-deoxyphosphogluconate aldolase/(4S)-4-hydroxy-2-oxoglutarate aldolase